MASNVVDRLRGVRSSQAIKVPCRVATTANITLSGEQTIDGVAVVDGDRVLVKDQNSGAENGIYRASTGNWTRAPDWDGSGDVVTGTLVLVNSGTTNAYTGWRVSTTGQIEIQTTPVAFFGPLGSIAVEFPVTAFMATLLDDADAATARTTLGLGSGDSPTFTALTLSGSLELENADTTLTRSRAGVPAVGGNEVAFQEPGINPQTGTTYTLALTDKGGIVTMDNAAPNTVTIPAQGTVAWPACSMITIIQVGAGTTTIEGATGVTINGVSAGSGDVGLRWQGVALLRVAENEWVASGSIGVVA